MRAERLLPEGGRKHFAMELTEVRIFPTLPLPQFCAANRNRAIVT